MSHTKNINIVHAKTQTANNSRPVYLSDETGRKLCAVWGSDEQRYANAALWANAPQMLELLKDYADTNKNVTDENPFVKKVRDIIKAVEEGEEYGS